MPKKPKKPAPTKVLEMIDFEGELVLELDKEVITINHPTRHKIVLPPSFTLEIETLEGIQRVQSKDVVTFAITTTENLKELE